MSVTIENYTQGNIYVELRWDKYSPHYYCFVGKEYSNGLVQTIKNFSYNTIEKATRSFKRQVAKVKKGEYE